MLRLATRTLRHGPRPTWAPASLALAQSRAASASAAEPATASSHLPDLAPPPPPPHALDFNNPREAYGSKTTAELLRSLLIFRLCRQQWLVRRADSLLSISYRVFGHSLLNWILKNTFYRQFVAGPDAEGIQPTLRRLRAAGVGAVLDYAAESDVAAESGAASRHPPADTVIGRTYKYEDERVCDARMSNFLTSIDAARSSDGFPAFTAIKVTALGLPRLLERVSTALVAVRGLFQQLDEDGNGFIDPGEFARVYSRLFTDNSDARMAQLYEYLDTDHDGKVDYVAFTKGVTVAEGAAIAARCRHQGPFAAAALTSEELTLLDNMMARVDTLAHEAADAGVRLLVDAEHSYFQPAIDSVVAALQRRHNLNEPRIYNTLQCYRTDVHTRMAEDLQRARQDGYKYGIKLVRGAYMVLERRRAAERGYPSPIFATKALTDAAYDAAVACLLPAVRDEGAEVMVATHNQRSVEAAVAGMAAAGLPPACGVSFGQLLGMADHLTFTLGAHGYGAFKYTPFGAVEEVVPYLLRRAQENSDVLGGVGVELGHLQTELMRRVVKRG